MMRARRPLPPPSSILLLGLLALASGCQGPPTLAPKAPPPQSSAEAPRSAERTARAFVEALARHEWQAALLSLDPSLTGGGKGEGVTPKTLEAFWKPLESEGPFQGIQGVALGRRGEVDVALVLCRFGERVRLVRLSILGEQRVAGLFHGTLAELAEPDARALVAALGAHDTATAHGMFGPELRAKVSETDLVALWQGVEREVGALQAVERVNVVARADVRVYLHARFAKGARVVMVGFDDRAQLAGLKILPESADPGWDAPAYAQPSAFTEKAVVVGSPPLPGVLSLPVKAGDAPAVVLLHRDGPQDEDESLGALRPFKDLAWGLASRGVAVLRYKKRALSTLPPEATEKEEVLEPALAAIELLRKTPGIDASRIIVLGHGQGGALAPRIARDARLQGLVVLAGPTKSLQENLVEQFTYLSSLDPGNAALRAQIEAWKKVRRQVEDPALLAGARVELPTGGAASGAYFLFARDHRPAATAAALACPVFVAQGERDFQVAPAQLAEWKKALARSPRATVKAYPGLSHLFMASLGDKPSPADYEGAGHVDEQVIADVAAFILGSKPVSPVARELAGDRR